MKPLLAIMLPLALSACSASPNPTTLSAASDASATAPAATPVVAKPSFTDLPRYHWQLDDAVDANGNRMDGLFDDSGKPLQLDFAKDRVMASNACNNISGGYRIIDGHLSAGPLMHTMRACVSPTLMQRESTITQMLGGDPSVILTSQDNAPQLVLTASDGTTLNFVGKPTAQTRYGGTGTLMFLEVAADEVPCHHPLMPNKSCIKVRELHYDDKGLHKDMPGPWQVMSTDIEGYTHEPGMPNVLRVKRYTRKDVPADASSYAYVLDLVVQSGPASASTTGKQPSQP